MHMTSTPPLALSSQEAVDSEPRSAAPPQGRHGQRQGRRPAVRQSRWRRQTGAQKKRSTALGTELPHPYLHPYRLDL